VVGDGSDDPSASRHDVLRVNSGSIVSSVQVTGSLTVASKLDDVWMSVGATSGVGSDIFFYVSGSITSSATPSTSRAVFGGDLIVSGSISLMSASTTSSVGGPGIGPIGTAQLNGSTLVTVYNAMARSDSLIFLTKQSDADTGHVPCISSKSSGHFTIKSGVGDADVVAYLIINPAGSLP